MNNIIYIITLCEEELHIGSNTVGVKSYAVKNFKGEGERLMPALGGAQYKRRAHNYRALAPHGLAAQSKFIK